jgi:hypothetical protein
VRSALLGEALGTRMHPTGRAGELWAHATAAQFGLNCLLRSRLPPPATVKCRRIGGPWVYFEYGTVEIQGHPEATAEYIWGDKTLRTLQDVTTEDEPACFDALLVCGTCCVSQPKLNRR